MVNVILVSRRLDNNGIKCGIVEYTIRYSKFISSNRISSDIIWLTKNPILAIMIMLARLRDIVKADIVHLQFDYKLWINEVASLTIAYLLGALMFVFRLLRGRPFSIITLHSVPTEIDEVRPFSSLPRSIRHTLLLLHYVLFAKIYTLIHVHDKFSGMALKLCYHCQNTYVAQHPVFRSQESSSHTSNGRLEENNKETRHALLRIGVVGLAHKGRLRDLQGAIAILEKISRISPCKLVIRCSLPSRELLSQTIAFVSNLKNIINRMRTLGIKVECTIKKSWDLEELFKGLDIIVVAREKCCVVSGVIADSISHYVAPVVPHWANIRLKLQVVDYGVQPLLRIDDIIEFTERARQTIRNRFNQLLAELKRNHLLMYYCCMSSKTSYR